MGLTKCHSPEAVRLEPNAPANTLGIRRIMIAVDDIEDVLGRLHAHGADTHRRAGPIRGQLPALLRPRAGGIIVALAEQLG